MKFYFVDIFSYTCVKIFSFFLFIFLNDFIFSACSCNNLFLHTNCFIHITEKIKLTHHQIPHARLLLGPNCFVAIFKLYITHQ
jgi:hypothetical protein